MQILHRLRGRLLTAGVFCALFATVAFSHQNERKTSAILSGTVVDSGTIQPIVGAHVVLKLGRIPQRDSTEENPVAEVLTDSRGHFQFDSLKPGEYSFFANKRGCLHSTLQVISLESGRIASREVDLDCLAKISGRVVTEAGHPIGGARVTALVGLMGAGVALTRMLNESGAAGLMTTSDSGGRFELFWPAEEGEVTLFAEALDYAPTRARVVRSGAEGDREEIAIRLLPGLMVSGHVLGLSGIPLSGATVKASRLQPKTDGLGVQEIGPWASTGGDGAFILKGLVKGTYALTVSHPTQCTLSIPKLEIDAATKELPGIFLPSPAKIEGRVTDVVGDSIAGAKIVAQAAGENISEEVVSNWDGHFALTQFSRGTTVLLWANAEGYVPTHDTIEAPRNDAPLVLHRQGTLRGRVEDSDTVSPLSDFRIRLARGSEEKSFRSNDGSFEWQGLPPGRWTFVAQAPGYQRTSLDVEIRSSDVTDGVVFLLRKGVELSGRVLDNDTNEPVPDVSVVYDEASVVAAPAFSLLKSMMQTTDSDGNFRFTGVPPVRVTIIARSPFYAQSQITVTAGESTSIEIRLSRGGVLSGHILSTDSRTPVPGARVNLFSETNGSASTITSDSMGFFLFNHLSSGRYRLMAEANFGQAPRQDIVLKENQQIEDLVMSIKSGATVHGNVRGTLRTEQKIVNLVAYGADGFSASTSTGLEGEYTISGVPGGPTRLLISTSTLRSMSVSIEVPAGTQDLNFDISFPQDAKLHGRVVQAGKPIAFADLNAIPVDPQMVRATTRTDEQGTYEIVGLSDGNYIVRVLGTQTKIRILGDTVLNIELSGISK